MLCVCKLNVYEGVGNLDHPVPAKRPSAYDVPVRHVLNVGAY